MNIMLRDPLSDPALERRLEHLHTLHATEHILL